MVMGTVSRGFRSDGEEVVIWSVDHQFGRHLLVPFQLDIGAESGGFGFWR